jgi:hypothetical protein
LSPGELLIFYFAPDTLSEQDDDYVLYRKVNHGDPELIARNLTRVPGLPFFRYMAISEPAGGLRLDSIPDNQLPLRHTARRHGSPADSASSARTDSIRGVRVSLRSVGTNVDGYTPEVQATRMVRFPNSGLAALQTCGGSPLSGIAPVAVFEVVDGQPQIRITWPQAIDEAGGEEDVVRYVLWKRVGAVAWGDPFRSIPAGAANYTTVDGDIESGQAIQYALAAQDCTPALSGLSTSAFVLVP